MAIYLDCNATTPTEPDVEEILVRFTRDEFGNEGSRTHEFGLRAKQAVQRARDQIAEVVQCQREEVIFTSGATESNNLALLGLRAFGLRSNKKHVVATAIEHKAVLEPVDFLKQEGFEVSIIPPESSGAVSATKIVSAVRPDTLCISVMQVNNETGVVQPIHELVSALKGHTTFLHVDAAQGFGKRISDLRAPRIDLISVSGHKIFGPKGVGALITRRRGFERPPLTPLMFGGGQERGLRPGTLPVALIAAFGSAAEIALRTVDTRNARCQEIKTKAIKALSRAGAVINGDVERSVPHTLNVSLPGVDSEAAILALKELVAVSNGSACTSQKYAPSHVLTAMRLDDDRLKSALRFSWCHLTPDVDWDAVATILDRLRN